MAASHHFSSILMLDSRGSTRRGLPVSTWATGIFLMGWRVSPRRKSRSFWQVPQLWWLILRLGCTPLHLGEHFGCCGSGPYRHQRSFQHCCFFLTFSRRAWQPHCRRFLSATTKYPTTTIQRTAPPFPLSPSFSLSRACAPDCPLRLFVRRYHGRQRTRGSPVRVYSNVPGNQLVLPAAEGYTFCTPCARYVAPTNKHCDKCGCCPSRDGRRWVHCERCRTCVKPGRIHCDVCKRCQPPGHDCDAFPLSSGRCHVCGSTEHKRIWHDSHDMHDRHGISVPSEKSPAAPEKKRRVATATEEWDVAIVPHR